MFLPLQVVIPENELGWSISFLHLLLMCPRAVTTTLCIRLFHDFPFRDFWYYAPLTPSQWNFDHLPHVLWFHGPDLILIQQLWLNRDFTILAFLLHWVLYLSMSRFAKLRNGVRSTVQIWSWFKCCDWIMISHIVISTSLMSRVFVTSNSQFTKLRHGVKSMIQIWSLFNDCD